MATDKWSTPEGQAAAAYFNSAEYQMQERARMSGATGRPAFEAASAYIGGDGYLYDQYGNKGPHAFGGGGASSGHALELESVQRRADGSYADQYGNPWTPPNAQAAAGLDRAVAHYNNPKPAGSYDEFGNLVGPDQPDSPGWSTASGRLLYNGAPQPDTFTPETVAGIKAQIAKTQKGGWQDSLLPKLVIAGTLAGVGAYAMGGAGAAGGAGAGLGGGGAAELASVGATQGMGGIGSYFTGAAGSGAGASGLSGSGALASEAGFLPGSFELGASGYGGTAASGLNAAGAEWLSAASGGLPQLPGSGLDLGEWGSGEAGMSGQAGNPSYANTSGVPTGTGTGGSSGGLPSLQSLAQAAGTASSAASRILDGTATAADWTSVLGALGQTGLGIYAGNQQADATSALGDRILNMGAPSLARYEASFQPGFNLWEQPGYGDALNTSWETGLRRASASAGNPLDNPGVMGELNKNIMGTLGLPALQNYRETNRAAGFGNVPQYAQIQTNAIGQQGGAWEAAGSGLENLLNPRQRPLTLNLGTTPP